MEPISLITAALVAGATAAAKDTAETAIQDAYEGLKISIKRKFEGKPKAEMIMQEYEADPETYEAPLKKKLIETAADKDEEIIQKAQRLLKDLDPQKSGLKKYQTVFQGEVKGMQLGDRNSQTNTF